MARAYTRIHRLFRVVTLLQSARGIKVSELAERCEMCTRTAYRDLDVLRESGVPCICDPDTGGYGVGKGFFMPPLELTFDESLALMVLAESAGKSGRIPFLAPAARAIEKIRGQLPRAIAEELGHLDHHVEMQFGPSSENEPSDVYERIRRAITTSRILRCKYESNSPNGNGQKPAEKFDLRPCMLWYCQRAWYVIGHHGGRGEVRNLKLSRFTAIELTDIPYAPIEDFKLDQHLGLAWRMMRGKKRHKVAIRFDPPYSETVIDTRWHSTQEEESHEDGSVTLRFTVDGLEEIVWWVMGYGPGCKVIEPPELVGRVADLAKRTAERYSPP